MPSGLYILSVSQIFTQSRQPLVCVSPRHSFAWHKHQNNGKDNTWYWSHASNTLAMTKLRTCSAFCYGLYIGALCSLKTDSTSTNKVVKKLHEQVLYIQNTYYQDVLGKFQYIDLCKTGSFFPTKLLHYMIKVFCTVPLTLYLTDLHDLKNGVI